MKAGKVTAVVLAVGVLIAAGVYIARITSVNVSWESKWPRSVRGVGEASERITPADGVAVTQADVARASERARWKAYYFAQLKLAEQLHRFKLSATTAVKDLVLTDQTLKTRLETLTAAAAEVEQESSVAINGNVAVAKVVVEAPAEQLSSFKDELIAALRSGRVTIDVTRSVPPEPTVAAAIPDSEPGTTKPQTASSSETRHDADAVGSGSGAEPARRADAAAVSSGTPPAPFTGVVVVVASGESMLKAAPSVFDAAGVDLGSALDLPADLQLAGLPIADSTSADSLKQWVGTNPLEVHATVSGGNLFIDRSLDAAEVTLFRANLKKGKIALVLENS